MKPYKKVKLIVNPNADRGQAWRWSADLRPTVMEFGGADWSGTVYPTHATELAYEAGMNGYDLVIAVGGDGTVHEVVNGLMKVPEDDRPVLGVVPLGTGNDFAHAIGMDKQSVKAIRQVFLGEPRKVDIGSVRDGSGRIEYFNNTVGIGFDATVTIRSRRISYFRGFLLYLVAVVQTILLSHDAPTFKMKIDGKEWEQELLMMVVCNSDREGGGFYIYPGAKIDDGIFNYTAIEKVSRPMMFRILPEVLKGTHAKFKQVHMGDFKSFELETDSPVYVHTDGEIFAGLGMDVRKLEFDILPGALTVVRGTNTE